MGGDWIVGRGATVGVAVEIGTVVGNNVGVTVATKPGLGDNLSQPNHTKAPITTAQSRTPARIPNSKRPPPVFLTSWVEAD